MAEHGAHDHRHRHFDYEGLALRMTMLIIPGTFVIWMMGSGTAAAEFALQSDGADPAALAPLDMFRDCDVCPEMIVMPPGSFMMGAIRGESRNPFDVYGPIDAKDFKFRVRAPDEINIIPNEHPRHRVTMDIPYAIARNETTHSEWMQCVDAGGCTHVPDHRVLTLSGHQDLGPQHPVVNVSYRDTLQYVAWLNSQVGNALYRLPTEAEWENAARASTETPFAQGNELTPEQANFSGRATENLLRVPRPDLVDRRMPVPVDDLDIASAWVFGICQGMSRNSPYLVGQRRIWGFRMTAVILLMQTLNRHAVGFQKGERVDLAMDSIRRQGAFDQQKIQAGISWVSRGPGGLLGADGEWPRVSVSRGRLRLELRHP